MAQKLILLSLILASLPAVLCAQIDSLSAQDSLTVRQSASSTPADLKDVKFPWTVRTFDKSEISRFPFRGTENYLPLVPGVVFVNNEFHLRGSRSNEAGYFIDGVDVTNPMFGSNGVPLIPEAMEALEVHTGAYGASMGSYNGGIVMSRMKKGGDRLSVSVNIQSDKFRSPGEQFLKTTVQGYENVVGTIGGPLPWFGARFFLAGQRTTMANRQPMFLEPFRYENLVNDGTYNPALKGQPLLGPVAFSRNWIPGNRSERSTFQGNGSVDFLGISLFAMGSYDEYEYPVGSEWPLALTNYFNQARNMISRTKTRFGAVQASYSWGDFLSATLSYSFYDRFSKTFDPIFKDNWLAYSDSAANARYFNTSEWRNRYYGPSPYSAIYYFNFTAPAAPNNKYSKKRQSESRWSIDLSSRPFPMLEVRAGGSISQWTMRSFSVSSISSVLNNLSSSYYHYWPATPYSERFRYIGWSGVSNYGYTVLGQRSDGIKLAGGPDVLLDPPYAPAFGSAYLEGTFESNDLLLQGGLRYEHYDPAFKKVNQFLGTATSASLGYDPAYEIIDESKIIPSEAMTFLLPRFNIQLTVSEGTRLFAGYGLFAQMPALDPLYYSSFSFSQRIAPGDRSRYGGEVSFDSRPERTKQFEFGIEQAVNSMIFLRTSAYYKVLSNQLQLARFFDQSGEPIFTQYRNNGNGLAKGIEVECDLRLSPHLIGQLSYAYSTAEGLSSNPRSNRVLFSDQMFPPIPATLRPLDYEQSHRITMVLRARTPADHGMLLGGIEATAVFTARSGHPYTREREVQYLGSYSVWQTGVSDIIDPRLIDPLEAHNSSTTPFTVNLDLRLSKSIDLDITTITLFVDILNLLNTKNVLNVYPRTGTANDDSWLGTPYSQSYADIPNYVDFYRDINLENRWAYVGATGYDIYSPPRQIRFGLYVQLGDQQ